MKAFQHLVTVSPVAVNDDIMLIMLVTLSRQALAHTLV